MMEGFILLCSILTVIYLLNVVFVIINICTKKKGKKSIAQINPYKFYVKLFWNMNDGFGTDRKVGILPIICSIMTFIGLWSIIINIIG